MIDNLQSPYLSFSGVIHQFSTLINYLSSVYIFTLVIFYRIKQAHIVKVSYIKFPLYI